jgi:hypothetical protein
MANDFWSSLGAGTGQQLGGFVGAVASDVLGLGSSGDRSGQAGRIGELQQGLMRQAIEANYKPVRRIVDDAKLAGLHPLFALGGGSQFASPSGTISGQSQSGDHRRDSLIELGEAAGKHLSSGKERKHASELHAASLAESNARRERDEAQAALARARAGKLLTATTNGGSNLESVAAAAGKTTPTLEPIVRPAKPGREKQGPRITSSSRVIDTPLGNWKMRSRATAEQTEDTLGEPWATILNIAGGLGDIGAMGFDQIRPGVRTMLQLEKALEAWNREKKSRRRPRRGTRGYHSRHR